MSWMIKYHYKAPEHGKCLVWLETYMPLPIQTFVSDLGIQGSIKRNAQIELTELYFLLFSGLLLLLWAILIIKICIFVLLLTLCYRGLMVVLIYIYIIMICIVSMKHQIGWCPLSTWLQPNSYSIFSSEDCIWVLDISYFQSSCFTW